MNDKRLLILPIILLLSLGTFKLFTQPGGKVLSATKVSSPSPFIKINCDYFQASWIQYKRDFQETQAIKYSTQSANQQLDQALSSFQQEATSKGCPPPHN